MASIRDPLQRFYGGILGLAVGDALGAAVEFKAPGTFQPVTGMRGGGPFDLRPGEWTDDTSMAACLAESHIARRSFDAHDQMDRYRQWYRAGYWSSRDQCFDIGNTTRAAIERFERSGQPLAGSTDPRTAGNGSIMRLAPVPLYFNRDLAEAVAMSAKSSLTTHAAETCLDACRLLGGLIVGAVQGIEKNALLSEDYARSIELAAGKAFCDPIADLASGSFQRRDPPEIRGTGYVVTSLEAALWAFARGEDFSDAVLRAVNLGDDADTTGAISGQLAGAYYGFPGIPRDWIEQLAWKKQLIRLSEHLYDASLTRE